MRRTLCLTIVLVLMFGLQQSAHALAQYHADLSMQYSWALYDGAYNLISDPGDYHLAVVDFADPGNQGAFYELPFSYSTVADVNSIFSMGLPDYYLGMEIFAEGWVVPPGERPVSYENALVGVVRNNLSDQDLHVEFTFDYDWNVWAAVDNPQSESASSRIELRAFSSYEDPLFYVLETAAAGESKQGTVTDLELMFDLPAGSALSFNVLGVAYGEAINIPEPSTLLLLGSGLIGLAAFRRRFRKG